MLCDEEKQRPTGFHDALACLYYGGWVGGERLPRSLLCGLEHAHQSETDRLRSSSVISDVPFRICMEIIGLHKIGARQDSGQTMNHPLLWMKGFRVGITVQVVLPMKFLRGDGLIPDPSP